MIEAAEAGSFEILMVEDNPGDVRLTREALKEHKVHHRLHHVSDGEQALAFLRRLGPYEVSPRPDLVLLDLNLPRKDGLEVLEVIKSDPGLKTIPVVVLTSSAAEEDIAASYMRHANCFVTKPVDFHRFVRIVMSIDEFWLEVVRLPGHA